MPAEIQIILGVDPGLNTTGYGFVAISSKAPRFIAGGTIGGGSAKVSLGRRLAALHSGLSQLIDDHMPRAMAIEEVYSHYAHPRTAVLMAHARGVLCLAAGERGIPIFEYSATAVKSSLTGNGRAPKDQVQRAVRYMLSLGEVPSPSDISDALALALCHAGRNRSSS